MSTEYVPDLAPDEDLSGRVPAEFIGGVDEDETLAPGGRDGASDG